MTAKKIITGFLILGLLASCATNRNIKGNIKNFFTERLYTPSKNGEAVKFFNEAVEFTGSKNYAKAIESYMRALEIDPGFSDAMNNLGVVYRVTGDYENAEKYFLRAIVVYPKNAVAMINLAVLYSIENDFDKSLAIYKKALSTEPDNPECYFGTGSLYFKFKKFDESIPFINRAIQKYRALKSENVYDAYYIQGMNYYFKKDWKKAVELLKIVKRAYPDNEELNKYLEDALKHR